MTMKLISLALFLIATSTIAQVPAPRALLPPLPTANPTAAQVAKQAALQTRLDAYAVELAAQRADAAKQNAFAAVQIEFATSVIAQMEAHNVTCHGEVPQAVYDSCTSEMRTRLQPLIDQANADRVKVDAWRDTVDQWKARLDAVRKSLNEDYSALTASVKQ
jgi:hypothetical protein